MTDNDTADYLAELATVDEVEAYIPTAKDHQEGMTPTWCELVLSITRTDDGTLNPSWPLNVRMPLRRHDGELIMEVLHSALHPNPGGAALEQCWDRLDKLVFKIMKRAKKGKDVTALKGEALGLAYAIAFIDSPMQPDVDGVRALAMERYDIRHTARRHD